MLPCVDADQVLAVAVALEKGQSFLVLPS
eukprot:SAG31_NODE_34875_length_328_cov_0.899563_2_plen_28_part_01